MKLRMAFLLLLSAATLGACTFLLPHPGNYSEAERIHWDNGNDRFNSIKNAQGRDVSVGDTSAHVPPDFRDPPMPPPPPPQN